MLKISSVVNFIRSVKSANFLSLLSFYADIPYRTFLSLTFGCVLPLFSTILIIAKSSQVSYKRRCFQGHNAVRIVRILSFGKV